MSKLIRNVEDPAALRRNERIAAESEQLRADTDFLLLLNGVDTVEEDESDDDITD